MIVPVADARNQGIAFYEYFGVLLGLFPGLDARKHGEVGLR